MNFVWLYCYLCLLLIFIVMMASPLPLVWRKQFLFPFSLMNESKLQSSASFTTGSFVNENLDETSDPRLKDTLGLISLDHDEAVASVMPIARATWNAKNLSRRVCHKLPVHLYGGRSINAIVIQRYGKSAIARSWFRFSTSSVTHPPRRPSIVALNDC